MAGFNPRKIFGGNVDGVEELSRDLDKLRRTDPVELDDAAARRATNRAKRAAEVEAPYRSGRLVRSLGQRVRKKFVGIKAGSRVRAPHAGPIHWGWPGHNIRPNMFMIRGINKDIRGILGEFESGVTKWGRSIGRRFF